MAIPPKADFAVPIAPRKRDSFRLADDGSFVLRTGILRVTNLCQVDFRMALWHFVDTAWVQHQLSV
jgi:hypothetical protein